MGNNVFFHINFLTRLVFFHFCYSFSPFPFRYEHILMAPDPVPLYALKLLVALTEHSPASVRWYNCSFSVLLDFFSVSIKFFPLEINSNLICAIILLRVCKIFRKCDLRYLENPREHNLTSFVPTLYDRGYFNMDLASETLETEL